MGLAKNGGALLERLGINQLSLLIIDADKDWQAFGIENIREVAAGMTHGDLILSNGAAIVALTPGAIGMILTTQGLGALPIWSHP